MKCFLLTVTLCFSTNLFSQEIRIKGNLLGLENKKIKLGYEIRVYEEGEVNPSKVIKLYDKYFPDDIAVFYASKKITDLRLEIFAKGYKKYTVNVPNITWSEEKFMKNIGDIILVASDLPRVTSIVHGYTKDNVNHYFEITFYNPLKKKILIKNMSLSSEQRRPDSFACAIHTPDVPTFVVDDKLIIIKKENENLVIEGRYSDTTSNVSIPIQGEIGFNECSHYNYLKLKFDCSYTLLDNDYSKIKIFFPQKLYTTQTQQTKKILNEFEKEYKAIVANNLLDFKQFIFKFYTDKTDELPIEASYELK